MSAALSETEADMLTRGREPVAKSSGEEKKQLFTKIVQTFPRKEHSSGTKYQDIRKLLNLLNISIFLRFK